MECLQQNIVPFIIEDSKRTFYYRGLSEWEHKEGRLMDSYLDGQHSFIWRLNTLDIAHT